MPNLPTHLSLASQVAGRVNNPDVNRHLGSFLLGSTSPDIRAMTKLERHRTHFAPLDIDRTGIGVAGLLETHPDLADAAGVSERTRVFLSGYFTHLMADETWILDIYLPHFNGENVVADPVLANIWDRALQLDMDRAAGDDLGEIGQVVELLEGSESEVGVDFIGSETLGQWREWVTSFIAREFTWDRLKFATRRMYRDDEGALEMAEAFLERMPQSLEEVYLKIPPERILAYRERVVGESVRVVKEYLGGPEVH